jgi:DNA-nicking Smr family endonuclease
MNIPLSSLTFNPFENIDVLLPKKVITCPRNPRLTVAPLDGQDDPILDLEAERQQFLDAMNKDGVKPMDRGRRDIGAIERSPAPRCPPTDEAAEVLLSLQKLVEIGEGFSVSETPEYMEGTGFRVPSSYAWRLHRGDFSIQAFIDLHGMNVEEAGTAVEAFLKDAVATGKRAVLIIHGRGLSSRAEPVLKNSVRSRLASRSWKKWLIAFTSAQSFDGGAGATYVLLRQHPFPGKSAKRPGN